MHLSPTSKLGYLSFNVTNGYWEADRCMYLSHTDHDLDIGTSHNVSQMSIIS